MYRLFTEPQNFETRCLVTSAHLCHIPPFPPYPRRLCLPCQLLWQHHCKRVNCTSCCAHCTAELRLRRMQTNNVLRKTTSQICNCWTLSKTVWMVFTTYFYRDAHCATMSIDASVFNWAPPTYFPSTQPIIIRHPYYHFTEIYFKQHFAPQQYKHTRTL